MKSHFRGTYVLLLVALAAGYAQAYEARVNVVAELTTWEPNVVNYTATYKPAARRGAASTSFMNGTQAVFILFGGMDSTDTSKITVYNDLWLIPMTDNLTYSHHNWTLLSANDPDPSGNYGISLLGLPSGRYGHTLSYLASNNTLMTYGGYSTACTDYCRDIWFFNLDTLTWSQSNSATDLITDSNLATLSSYWTTKDDVTLFTYASGEYCFQYNVTFNITQWNGTLSERVPNPDYGKCVDYRLGPWKRWHHSMVVYDDKFWLFGGYSVLGGYTGFLNDMWTLSWNFSATAQEIKGDGYAWVWREIRNTTNVLPRERRHHKAVVYNNMMYIFGGYQCCAVQPYFMNDIWKYDFAANLWSEVLPNGTVPDGRHGHSLVVIDQTLMVFGGYKSPDLVAGTATSDFLNDIWQYNVTANLWVKIEQYGAADTIMRPLWESTMEVLSTSVVRDASYLPKKMIASNPTENWVFMFGGYNGTTVQDALLRYDQYGCFLDCHAANSSNGECWNNLCLCNVDGTSTDSGHWGPACDYPKCDTAATCTFDLLYHNTSCIHCAGTGLCNVTTGTGLTAVGGGMYTSGCVCEDGWTGLDCGTLTCSKNCSNVGRCPLSGNECECPMYTEEYANQNDYLYESQVNCPTSPFYPQFDYYNATTGSKMYKNCDATPFRMYHGLSCETPHCLFSCSSVGRCNHPNCQCQDSYEGMGCQHQVVRGSGSILKPVLHALVVVLIVALFL